MRNDSLLPKHVDRYGGREYYPGSTPKTNVGVRRIAKFSNSPLRLYIIYIYLLYMVYDIQMYINVQQIKC